MFNTEDEVLRGLQEKNLEMAVMFYRWCQRNHLTCYLCGGGCAIAPLRESWHRLRSLAHQKKRREFPESENRLAQLLLFAWGCMPRMGAGLGMHRCG